MPDYPLWIVLFSLSILAPVPIRISAVAAGVGTGKTSFIQYVDALHCIGRYLGTPMICLRPGLLSFVGEWVGTSTLISNLDLVRIGILHPK